MYNVDSPSLLQINETRTQMEVQEQMFAVDRETFQ